MVVGGLVIAVELVKRVARLAQVGREDGEREPRAGSGAGRGDGQCQRKARAAVDDLVDRVLALSSVGSLPVTAMAMQSTAEAQC